jgi:putative flippase GtrA
MSLLRALVVRFRALLSELAKFGTVGFISLGVDLLVFNLVLSLAPDRPLTAKVCSTVVSATNAFVLNRFWSFKHRTRTTLHREYSLFAVLNAVGLGISLLCLSISHYVLGFESRLADNIAANGVGLVLGTAFRFWSYRKFVWAAPDEVAAAEVEGDAAAHAVLGDVRDGTIHR